MNNDDKLLWSESHASTELSRVSISTMMIIIILIIAIIRISIITIIIIMIIVMITEETFRKDANQAKSIARSLISKGRKKKHDEEDDASEDGEECEDE